MCCHIRSASVSRRRQVKLRKTPTLPPLGILDLSKPGERQAHEFLLRTTNKRDQMWTVLDLRRHGNVLLCVVRWVHPADASKPFALAEVSLTETAVHWRVLSRRQGCSGRDGTALRHVLAAWGGQEQVVVSTSRGLPCLLGRSGAVPPRAGIPTVR